MSSKSRHIWIGTAEVECGIQITNSAQRHRNIHPRQTLRPYLQGAKHPRKYCHDRLYVRTDRQPRSHMYSLQLLQGSRPPDVSLCCPGMGPIWYSREHVVRWRKFLVPNLTLASFLCSQY